MSDQNPRVEESKKEEETAASDVTNFDNYKTESILGEGAYGKVYKVLFVPTQKSLALKIFKPVHNLQQLYSKEVESLKHVKGDSKFVQIFAQLDQFRLRYKGIAMEFCPGGELLKYIMLKKGLGEQDVRTYLHQIVAILEALQEKKLAHLDIKAENFFLDRDYNLVLGDFGMCETLETATQVISDYRKGSPSYLLYEQLQQVPYRAIDADLFAAAVTMFSIYSCLLPFKQQQQYGILFNNPQIFWQMVRQNSPSVYFQDHLSKHFVDLFMRMVHPHPTKRITLEQIKQHPFYLGEQVMELQQSIQKTMDDINSNSNSFNAKNPNNSNSIEVEHQLTRGAEKVSIREQFELFECSVSNLMKKRVAKVYDQNFGRLSDFKTNIDSQTLFEFLFINQELFTSQLPVLSDKSYKIKCVYKQDSEPLQASTEAHQIKIDKSVEQSPPSTLDFISLEAVFESLKIEEQLSQLTIPETLLSNTVSEQPSPQNEVHFNIVIKTDASNKNTFVDFVRKSGDAFAFYEVVVKVQNLIQSFK